VKKASLELEQWRQVKRLHRLTDAQVQMGRELGMKPQRLLKADSPKQEPLTRSIERLYLRRFRKPLPDSVIPLRQALHEVRTQERTEARERRRRKRQTDRDHLGAMRVSMLTLRRLCGGVGADEDPGQLAE
jgi:hypothetical protein